MPRGDKSKYTAKQHRKADHIAEGYEQRGVPEDEAERRAWATVNKDDGGGNRPGGSGHGTNTGHPAAHRGGQRGGTPPQRPLRSRQEGRGHPEGPPAGGRMKEHHDANRTGAAVRAGPPRDAAGRAAALSRPRVPARPGARGAAPERSGGAKYR